VTKEEERYRNWIATRPCAVSQTLGVAHDNGQYLNNPCHVISRGANGVFFGNLIPLSQELHNEMHNIGWTRFSAKYRIDPFALAQKYQREYDQLEESRTK
jgi:hypothetical protein